MNGLEYQNVELLHCDYPADILDIVSVHYTSFYLPMYFQNYKENYIMAAILHAIRKNNIAYLGPNHVGYVHLKYE